MSASAHVHASTEATGTAAVRQEITCGVTNCTYSGAPVNDVRKGLPKTIRSLCPECMKVIDARLFDEAGRVIIEKTCPEHGHVRDLYWSDTDLYLKAEKWTFEDGSGLLNPRVRDATACPAECGL